MFPTNPEIEKCVLGCLLLGKQDYVVKLSEKDFANDDTRAIYKAIRELYDRQQAIDVITVADAVKRPNALEVVTKLTDYVPTAENIEHYISTLKTYTMRREIIKASMKAREMAESDRYESAIDLKNDVMQAFDIEVHDGGRDDNSMQAVVLKTLQEIEEDYNSNRDYKLLTGFSGIDKLTAGLHPQELTIIAARPGIGKTNMAVQLAINLGKKGNKVLFVSREMSQTQLCKRIISNAAKVDGQLLRQCKLLSDDDWKKIGDATGKIAELPIEINTRLATVQEIRGRCRDLRNKDNLDVLIVDYLQLCRSLKKHENRRQEIEDVSRQLKEIAMEFNIPVIALSQLTRDSARNAREPELYDLRETGGIEQDADVVMFLYIPPGTDETQDNFDIKVLVKKQRNGPLGYAFLRYYKRTFQLYG